MPQFTPSQKQLTDFNNGNKFVNHVDSPSADDFNNVIESQLYTQGLAKNTPDTSEANNVGTPSVIIVIAPDGTAQLKFSNLKGAGISNILPNGTDQSGNNIYVIQLTDGSSYNFTSPKGSQGIQGEQGIGIANIIPNGQDSTGSNIYTVLLTNGTSYNFTAPKGAQGIQGNTGVGISTITPNGTDINGGNIYRITLTDGSYYDFTAPKGNQGENANDPNAVHFTEQELTSSQQSQARENINAAATNGSYPTLGAGYLSRTNAIITNGAGWYKLATLNASALSTVAQDRTYSAIVDIQGVNPAGKIANNAASSRIEIDAVASTSGFVAGNTAIKVLSGYVDPSTLCAVTNTNEIVIYVYYGSLNRTFFTIVSEVWVSSHIEALQFTIDNTPITSAPENAVYAVVRNNASRLSNTSAIGNSTTPVYFSAEGVPVECDDIAVKPATQTVLGGIKIGTKTNGSLTELWISTEGDIT